MEGFRALQLDRVCRLRQVHDYTQDFISGFNVTMRRLRGSSAVAGIDLHARAARCACRSSSRQMSFG